MKFLSIIFHNRFSLLIIVLALTFLAGCDTEPDYVRAKRTATYTKVSAVASENARVTTDPSSNELVGCIIKTEIDSKTWFIKLRPSYAWHLYAGCAPIVKGDPLDITKRVMDTGQTDLLWKGIVELEDTL
jgi:hypothetical protein